MGGVPVLGQELDRRLGHHPRSAMTRQMAFLHILKGLLQCTGRHSRCNLLGLSERPIEGGLMERPDFFLDALLLILAADYFPNSHFFELG